MKSLQGLGDEEQEAPFRGRYLTDISELLIEGLVRLCCAVVLIFPLNVQAQLHPETAVRKKKKDQEKCFCFHLSLGKASFDTCRSGAAVWRSPPRRVRFSLAFCHHLCAQTMLVSWY